MYAGSSPRSVTIWPTSGTPSLSLGVVHRGEDLAGDADLLERGDAAVEDVGRPGGERLVAVPLEVGREDRSEQQKTEDDPGVPRGERPAAVKHL